MTENVDVVVVGMGVGGEEVASRLAEAGLDVLGVEGRLVGGECPYWACIPSKMVVRAADLLAETARVDGMAGRAHAIPDWEPVVRRIRQEATDNWDDRVAVERYRGTGGRFVRGWATITGPDTVTVDGTDYRARRGLVIATGTVASIPPVTGLADVPYWTNRELMETPTLPDSLLVLGGGAIGVEMAQALSRFGTEVTIVEADDRVMGSDEPEASRLIRDVLEAEGVTIHVNAKASAVGHDDRGFTVDLDGSRLHGERLLVSAGRRADLTRLGVDAAGLDPNAASIAVDGRMRAGRQLWAVGDVTGRGAFTHVAMYQAGIVVRDILGRPGPSADYRALPRVTFTDPEVGSAGLTEAQARREGRTVAVGIAQLPETSRGWLHKAGNAGFIKLVVDTEENVIVGATSVGPMGGEVLGALVVAIRARVPVDTLRDTMWAYPTFHRGIGDALAALSLSRSPRTGSPVGGADRPVTAQRSDVLGRAHGGGATEVAGQVGLIGVTEFGRQDHPGRFGPGPFHRLVDPVPVDDPFRTHPDLLGEQPLQNPWRPVSQCREFLDPTQPPVGAHPLGEVAGQPGPLAQRLPMPQQEFVDGRDPLRVGGR